MKKSDGSMKNILKISMVITSVIGGAMCRTGVGKDYKVSSLFYYSDINEYIPMEATTAKDLKIDDIFIKNRHFIAIKNIGEDKESNAFTVISESDITLEEEKNRLYKLSCNASGAEGKKEKILVVPYNISERKRLLNRIETARDEKKRQKMIAEVEEHSLYLLKLTGLGLRIRYRGFESRNTDLSLDKESEDAIKAIKFSITRKDGTIDPRFKEIENSAWYILFRRLLKYNSIRSELYTDNKEIKKRISEIKKIVKEEKEKKKEEEKKKKEEEKKKENCSKNNASSDSALKPTEKSDNLTFDNLETILRNYIIRSMNLIMSTTPYKDTDYDIIRKLSSISTFGKKKVGSNTYSEVLKTLTKTLDETHKKFLVVDDPYDLVEFLDIQTNKMADAIFNGFSDLSLNARESTLMGLIKEEARCIIRILIDRYLMKTRNKIINIFNIGNEEDIELSSSIKNTYTAIHNFCNNYRYRIPKEVHKELRTGNPLICTSVPNVLLNFSKEENTDYALKNISSFIVYPFGLDFIRVPYEIITKIHNDINDLSTYDRIWTNPAIMSVEKGKLLHSFENVSYVSYKPDNSMISCLSKVVPTRENLEIFIKARSISEIENIGLKFIKHIHVEEEHDEIGTIKEELDKAYSNEYFLPSWIRCIYDMIRGVKPMTNYEILE